ncbi:MAG: sigma-70 family RNA polymerase sigma factor [Acidobacteriales bacterium]|nr:sigma-70 family RNA polymerase sigma factor [Terriglobales bacterium]
MFSLHKAKSSETEGQEADSSSIWTDATTQKPEADTQDWAALVKSIQTGDPQGMETLYNVFARGVRFYLCRQLGPQELDDKVHDVFLIVVNAIRRGEVREPERLMGFVRTVARRQVAAHIDRAVQRRKDQVDVESGVRLVDWRLNPEQDAIAKQREELMERILRSVSRRDREILTRFYLQEQPQEQICLEMHLTETQFRLLKSRAKSRFSELGRKKLLKRPIPAVCLRKAAGSAH